MTALQKLKRMLYEDSHAAETDHPKITPAPSPAPELTAEQIAGMDEMAGLE